MNPFNEDTVCPKCAGKDVIALYMPPRESMHRMGRHYKPPEGKEFFHRECRRCHFNWPEACEVHNPAEEAEKIVGKIGELIKENPSIAELKVLDMSGAKVEDFLIYAKKLVKYRRLTDKYETALQRIMRMSFSEGCCETELSRLESDGEIEPGDSFVCESCSTTYDLMYYPTGRTPMQIATDVLRETKDETHS